MGAQQQKCMVCWGLCKHGRSGSNTQYGTVIGDRVLTSAPARQPRAHEQHRPCWPYMAVSEGLRTQRRVGTDPPVLNE